MLNERTAWQVVGMIFDSRNGICISIAQLERDKLISQDTMNAMDKAIIEEQVRLQNFDSYLWPRESFSDCDFNRREWAQAQEMYYNNQPLQQLTLKEAWQVLVIKHGSRDGICMTIDQLYTSCLIEAPVRHHMQEVIALALTQRCNEGGYLFPRIHSFCDVDRQGFANEQLLKL